jgi:hypothetical protein
MNKKCVAAKAAATSVARAICGDSLRGRKSMIRRFPRAERGPRLRRAPSRATRCKSIYLAKDLSIYA